MSNRIRVADLPEFDLAEQLENEQDIAAYLSAVLGTAIRPSWRAPWA